MRSRTVLSLFLLTLCAAALMAACGRALSGVFLQLRGPSLLLGL